MDHYDKIVNILDKPYFKNLETMGIDKEHYNEIFERLYNKKLDIIITQETFFNIKDENGNLIYHEDTDGHWYKSEYDENGNQIYHEDHSGDWYKYDYDEYGKMNYYEDSNGITIS